MFDTGVMVATAAVICLSLSLGSFFTVVVERLNTVDGLAGRSRCRACRQRIAWYDLLPLVSWCWLKARCRSCTAPISMLYPGIEAAALLSGLIAVSLFDTLELLAVLLLGWTLVLIAAFDIRHFILPWPLTAGLAVLGVGLGFAGLGLEWDQRLIGWCVGFVAFTGVQAGYRVWRNREGLGGGDVWLFAAAGAWVGPFALVWVLLLASGGALVMTLLSQRDNELRAETKIPFGAWLSAATWMVFVAEGMSG